MARRSDIHLCNNILKKRMLAEKPHCTDWQVYDKQTILFKMQNSILTLTSNFKMAFAFSSEAN